jgi:acyl-coenzyme A synthetase/AMP-(fatty) acid ligase
VPKEGAELELAELVEFLRGEVADYKLPESLEKFSELPMTGTGKLRRHVLRDWVLERHRKAV